MGVGFGDVAALRTVEACGQEKGTVSCPLCPQRILGTVSSVPVGERVAARQRVVWTWLAAPAGDAGVGPEDFRPPSHAVARRVGSAGGGGGGGGMGCRGVRCGGVGAGGVKQRLHAVQEGRGAACQRQWRLWRETSAWPPAASSSVAETEPRLAAASDRQCARRSRAAAPDRQLAFLKSQQSFCLVEMLP